MRYNTTSFTVHATDNVIPLTCNVRYLAVKNSSVVYYEKQFVVFNDLVKAEPKHRERIEQNKNSGKYTVSQYNVHPFNFCDNFPNCKPI